MAYLKSFYFKDEYGFPLSLIDSMKYCELDKVPCLKCEESGKKWCDRHCIECNRIIFRFINVMNNNPPYHERTPTGRTGSLIHKEDCQVGHMCYKLVEKELELFKLIPADFKSWELCRYAVKKDPLMIEYVSDWFIRKGKLIDYFSVDKIECVIF